MKARQKLVIKRWSNFLRINILSFTSCCNETIRVGEQRGGVCDQFIVPVCISYRQGPHALHYTTHLTSPQHTSPPSYHPASQHFFPTVGYFPSGLTVELHLAWLAVLLDAWDDTISLGGGLPSNYRRDQAAIITGPDTPHHHTSWLPGQIYKQLGELVTETLYILSPLCVLKCKTISRKYFQLRYWEPTVSSSECEPSYHPIPALPDTNLTDHLPLPWLPSTRSGLDTGRQARRLAVVWL